MYIIKKIKSKLLSYVKDSETLCRLFKKQLFPGVDCKAKLGSRYIITDYSNIILEEGAYLKRDSVILNGRANFIMRRNSGSAEELMVISGNHMSVVGLNLAQVTNNVKDRLDTNNEYDKDVIVDEDVWIGARVTLLSGVHIGRGCEVGAGAVVRSSTPLYSIVFGNPAKIVGFRFTPEEIIEHEKAQYPEEERLPLELLEKNYKKYFLDHIKEIKAYTGLICK